MKRLSLAVIAAISLGCSTAHAASFDCGKASAPDEITICDSRELSQLDVKMATLYDTVIKLVGMGVRGDMQDRAARLASQRGADCGHDRACIRKLYESRIGALEGEVARIAKGGPY